MRLLMGYGDFIVCEQGSSWDDRVAQALAIMPARDEVEQLSLKSSSYLKER